MLKLLKNLRVRNHLPLSKLKGPVLGLMWAKWIGLGVGFRPSELQLPCSTPPPLRFSLRGLHPLVVAVTGLTVWSSESQASCGCGRRRGGIDSQQRLVHAVPWAPELPPRRSTINARLRPSPVAEVPPSLVRVAGFGWSRVYCMRNRDGNPPLSPPPPPSPSPLRGWFSPPPPPGIRSPPGP